MQRQTDTHKETKEKCLNAKDKTAYILEALEVKINEVKWNIDRKLGCNAYNIVYGKICKKDKCKEVYTGETKRMLKSRLSDHCGYIVNKDRNTATSHHFNLPGHSLADLSVILIEQVKKKNTL